MAASRQHSWTSSLGVTKLDKECHRYEKPARPQSARPDYQSSSARRVSRSGKMRFGEASPQTHHRSSAESLGLDLYSQKGVPLPRRFQGPVEELIDILSEIGELPLLTAAFTYGLRCHEVGCDLPGPKHGSNGSNEEEATYIKSGSRDKSLARIRALTAEFETGLPPFLRPIVWDVLLRDNVGCSDLATNHSKRLEASEVVYSNTDRVSLLYTEHDHAAVNLSLHLISSEADRTRLRLPFFEMDQVKRSLELLAAALCIDADAPYIPGMTETLAPMLTFLYPLTRTGEGCVKSLPTQLWTNLGQVLCHYGLASQARNGDENLPGWTETVSKFTKTRQPVLGFRRQPPTYNHLQIRCYRCRICRSDDGCTHPLRRCKHEEQCWNINPGLSSYEIDSETAMISDTSPPFAINKNATSWMKHRYWAGLLSPEIPGTHIDDVFDISGAFIAQFLPHFLPKREMRSVPNGPDSAELRVHRMSSTPEQQWKQLGLVLKYLDPALLSRLEGGFISPQIYAVRWFATGFAASFPIDVVLSLWDRLISANDCQSQMLVFFAVALLVANRSELMTVYCIRTFVTELGCASPEEVDKIWNSACSISALLPPDWFDIVKESTRDTLRELCPYKWTLDIGAVATSKKPKDAAIRDLSEREEVLRPLAFEISAMDALKLIMASETTQVRKDKPAVTHNGRGPLETPELTGWQADSCTLKREDTFILVDLRPAELSETDGVLHPSLFRPGQVIQCSPYAANWMQFLKGGVDKYKRASKPFHYQGFGKQLYSNNVFPIILMGVGDYGPGQNDTRFMDELYADLTLRNFIPGVVLLKGGFRELHAVAVKESSLSEVLSGHTYQTCTACSENNIGAGVKSKTWKNLRKSKIIFDDAINRESPLNWNATIVVRRSSLDGDGRDGGTMLSALARTVAQVPQVLRCSRQNFLKLNERHSERLSDRQSEKSQAMSSSSVLADDESAPKRKKKGLLGRAGNAVRKGWGAKKSGVGGSSSRAAVL